MEIKRLEKELFYVPINNGNYFIFSSRDGSWIVASELLPSNIAKKYLPNKTLSAYEDVRDIVINTTDNCNLGCKYCYVGRHKKRDLTLDGFKKIIKSLFHLYEKEIGKRKAPIEICFHGSEPLENWDEIRKMIKYVYNINKKIEKDVFKMTLQTNATLVDDNKAKFLFSHNVGVGVSIDGYKEIHDKSRPYLNGEGSFEDVMKGIKSLYKYYGSINALCVVSALNVKELKKLYMWFKDIKIFNQIRFLFLHPNRFGEGVELLPEMNELAKNYLPIFRAELEKVILGNNYFVDNIESRIINFVLPKVYPVCGKCANTFIQPAIFIDIDGSLRECDCISNSSLSKYKIFDYKEIGDILNSKDNFRTNFNKIAEACKTCPILYICGAGCPAEVIDKKNYYCEIYRKEYEMVMKNIIGLSQIIE